MLVLIQGSMSDVYCQDDMNDLILPLELSAAVLIKIDQ